VLLSWAGKTRVALGPPSLKLWRISWTDSSGGLRTSLEDFGFGTGESLILYGVKILGSFNRGFHGLTRIW